MADTKSSSSVNDSADVGAGHVVHQISRGAEALHLGVSVLTLGINPVANRLLDPYRTIGEMVMLTAPLTVSAAVVTALVLGGSFSKMAAAGKLITLVTAVLAPYLIAEYFGLVAGSPQVGSGWALLQYARPDKAVFLILSILQHYFSLYGLAKTLSSVACGGYLGWVWMKTIAPRIH